MSDKESNITDLLYFMLSNDEKRSIVEAFPDAVFEAIYDEIHEHRTIVQLRANKEDWYRFLLKKEWAEMSLWFNFSIYEDTKMIKRLVEQWRSGQ